MPVQMGGGVDGWDKQAQALVMDEQQMGTCTSVDTAIAMNMRLCAALRAVLVDANVERTKLADEKENELAPQLQARRSRQLLVLYLGSSTLVLCSRLYRPNRWL